LAIIAEGITEVGFTGALLAHALRADPLQYGVHISNGGGNDATLGLLEALAAGGLRFGCFADDEGTSPGRWKAVIAKQGTLAFRWQSGCLEENVIGAVAPEDFPLLIEDPNEEKTSQRLRTLQERLNCPDKGYETIKAHAGSGLRQLIIDAACGTVPPGKEGERKISEAHARHWFKSESGGRELEGKVFSLGLWARLGPQLLLFCNAVRQTSELPDLADLT
jgi:putative ATP-dependent endonuclease of OLD family